MEVERQTEEPLLDVINEEPPNYLELKQFFPLDLPDYVPLFPWGDKVYNPSGKEIAPDIIFHEYIHSLQQGGDPEWWWKRYMNSPEFRLEQEVEAYAKQYLFVKTNLNAKAAKDCLFECADNLSSPLYQLDLTYSQAETLIRHRAKKIEEANFINKFKTNV